MAKDLFKVTMTLNRQCIIRYLAARSEKQAKMLAVNKVADEHGVHPIAVAGYFKEHPDRLLITTEIKFDNE